jgi:macrolide transport system ATP-binding/permease protein
MTGFFQDVRHALRHLRKSPGFACTAILMLAMGICANVAVFGFVDASLIKPLPYGDPSRVVGVFESDASTMRGAVSYLDYVDWRNLNAIFSSIDAYALNGGFTLGTTAGAEQVAGTRVSDGFFHTLGITPALGRDFPSGEQSPAAPRTVLISYAAWQKRFGGAQDVLGQAVTLNGVADIIIGVLPRDFHFAPAGAAEFWGMLSASDPCEQRRDCHHLNVVARLRDGVSVRTALAAMKSLTQQLAEQYPDTNRDQSADVVLLRDVIVGDVRPILLALLSGASLLLLIAGMNVTGLLLARSESCKREIAVRGALGGSRLRLIRQFATEELVLVVVASLLGLISAEWAMQLLNRLIPADMRDSMPYLQGLGLNFRVVAFACAISLLAATLFAIIPTLRLSVSELREGLTEGSRGYAGTMWRRLGANLVVVELAIAMVLLVGAGLLGESLYRLLHVDIGLKPDHLTTLQIEGSPSSYSKDAQAIALARQVEDRIASLPGVKSVGISNALPVSSGWGTTWFQIVGRPNHGEHNEAFNRQVSPNYFATLQARLLHGRYFSEAEDVSKPQVAIINQTLAKQYFSGGDPVGKQIFYFAEPQAPMQIVGVVDDLKEAPLDTEIRPALYVPIYQHPLRSFAMAVRSSQVERSLFPELAAAIHQVDPDISIFGEATMIDRINDSPAAYLHRSSAWLVGGFAAMALLLGVVGLYGAIAYSVSQRTREIGVRMALGAQRKSVYHLILKEAAWLTGAGIASGIVCSMAAATLIRRLLFGVHSWNATVLAAVSGMLAISALLASYIPARRAAKVDPLVALRYE